MIQFSQAKELLHRFMDGLTTEEEEQKLSDFMLLSDEVPEEWEEYREMFRSFTSDAYAFSDAELESMTSESDDATFADSHGAARHTLFIYRAAACAAFLLASAAVTLWFADYSGTERDYTTGQAAPTAKCGTTATGVKILAEKTGGTPTRVTEHQSKNATAVKTPRDEAACTSPTITRDEQTTTHADSVPTLTSPTEDSCEMPGFHAIMADISSECYTPFRLQEEDDSTSPDLYAPAREPEAERKNNDNDSPSLAQASTFDIPSITINDVPGF